MTIGPAGPSGYNLRCGEGMADRARLAVLLNQFVASARGIDPADYTAVELRLLDCLCVLGQELAARIDAPPLTRIVIEHDLHRLNDLPLFRHVNGVTIAEIVRRMESPVTDSDDECRSRESVSS